MTTTSSQAIPRNKGTHNCQQTQQSYIQYTLFKMATLTMSSSHAGPDAFSHSMRHTSHSTTAPHSATADTLPSIDFGFDNLRRDMSQFRLQFDDFIERGRRRVLAERSQFQAKIADIQSMFTQSIFRIP